MSRSRASKIKYIVIHCSAGFGELESIQNHWKTLGWKSPGYHRLINRDGIVYNLASFDSVTNGVKGYNSNSIHICYIGGVEASGKDSKGNVIYKAKDTRTEAQSIKIIECILEALNWLKANGNNLTEIKILGHRDFSPDINGNGLIESWERIKECPSFDAIKEYGWIVYSNENNKAFDLPNEVEII